MNLKNIIKFSSIHLFILTLVLFLRFNDIEDGDMNVVIFGTLLYLPYLIFLAILNSTLLTIGLNHLTSPLKWLGALLTIWWLSSNGQLEIRFWKVKQNEFLTLNLIIFFINLATIYFVTKQQKDQVK